MSTHICESSPCVAIIHDVPVVRLVMSMSTRNSLSLIVLITTRRVGANRES